MLPTAKRYFSVRDDELAGDGMGPKCKKCDQFACKCDDFDRSFRMLELAYTRYQNIYIAVWRIFQVIVGSIAIATVASMFRVQDNSGFSSEALIACSIALLEFWYWGIFRSHDRYGDDLSERIIELQADKSLRCMKSSESERIIELPADKSLRCMKSSESNFKLFSPRTDNNLTPLQKLIGFNYLTFQNALEGKFRTNESLGIAMSFFHVMVILLVFSFFQQSYGQKNSENDPNPNSPTSGEVADKVDSTETSNDYSNSEPPYDSIRKISIDFCNSSSNQSYCEDILRVSDKYKKQENLSRITRVTFILWLLFLTVYTAVDWFVTVACICTGKLKDHLKKGFIFIIVILFLAGFWIPFHPMLSVFSLIALFITHTIWTFLSCSVKKSNDDENKSSSST